MAPSKQIYENLNQNIANALGICLAIARMPRRRECYYRRSNEERTNSAYAAAIFERAKARLDASGQATAHKIYMNCLCDRVGSERIYPM